MARKARLGEKWCEAWAAGRNTYVIELELDEAEREFRRHERKRRKAESKARKAAA